MSRRPNNWTPRLAFCLGLALTLALLCAFAAPALANRAMQIDGQVLYGITTKNELVAFSSSAPDALLHRRALQGLQAGERVLGLDARPATGQLYVLGSTSRLYTLDPGNGQLTLVGSGPLTTTIQGGSIGFDFNPVVDRIRVVSDSGQNLRLNPDTGAIAGIDSTLAYSSTDTNAGRTPRAVAAAYTNNVSGTTSTTLYLLDRAQDVLVTQIPPNAGVLNTVGSLGLDLEELAGFDIAPDGRAYAALLARDGISGSVLMQVDLATGQLSRIGRIGGGLRLTAFAIPTTAP